METYIITPMFVYKRPRCVFLSRWEVPIISTVDVEVMSISTLVDATIEVFSTPSIPKHAGKTDYITMIKCHQLLTENTALVEI